MQHPHATPPTPEEIKALRTRLGLSQTAFGELVHAKLRTVQDWERGIAAMHTGLWELATIKAEWQKTPSH